MPVTVSPVAVEDYLVGDNHQIDYLDVHHLFPLFDKMAFKINVILLGETGIAKSSAFAKYAQKHKWPLITHWCSDDQRREHLIGHLTLEDKQTVYHLGPLPRAVEIANQFGSAILLLEEINGLTNTTQKLLNSLTDWHRNVATDYGTYRLLPERRLWVVGTMNSSAYGGTYTLNTDLKSRMRILPLGYAAKEKEQEVVHTLVEKADPKLVEKVMALAQLTRQGTVDYAISPRDVVDLVRDAGIVGLGEAIRLQSGKFEGAERATFVEWVKTTFPTEMLKVKKSA